jgi:hypothetical protein
MPNDSTNILTGDALVDAQDRPGLFHQKCERKVKQSGLSFLVRGRRCDRAPFSRAGIRRRAFIRRPICPNDVDMIPSSDHSSAPVLRTQANDLLRVNRRSPAIHPHRRTPLFQFAVDGCLVCIVLLSVRPHSYSENGLMSDRILD